MAREALRAARLKAGMTQRQVADALGVSLRHYCKVEAGDVLGSIAVWDALEDLFATPQRELRRTGPGASRRTCRG